jgi:hypothetical protein
VYCWKRTQRNPRLIYGDRKGNWIKNDDPKCLWTDVRIANRRIGKNTDTSTLGGGIKKKNAIGINTWKAWLRNPKLILFL